MKKTIILLLIMALCITLLAGCGGDNSPPDVPDNSQSDAQNETPDNEPDDIQQPETTAPESTPNPAPEPEDDTLPEALAWWDGEWYGFWRIPYADGPYASYAGGMWDCYAIIEVAADGTAMITLWDDDVELASLEAVIYPDAGGIMGGLTSEGGELFGHTSERAEWVINPVFSTHSDMIQIVELYSDPDGDGFKYEIFLRPWGMLWDDVPEEDRPPGYDWWYVSEGSYTMTMFDALSAGYDDSPDSSDGSSDSSDEITGSSDDAVILDLTNEELKATWKAFQGTYSTWSDITYDDVVVLFGVEGVLARESDNMREFRWYASDDGSIDVQFSKDTGGFLRSAINAHGRP